MGAGGEPLAQPPLLVGDGGADRLVPRGHHGVDRFAGHHAVDTILGQHRLEDPRRESPAEIRAEQQPLIAQMVLGTAQQIRRQHAPVWIGRALDQQAAGQQRPPHRLPRRDHLGFVILAEHVQRADDPGGFAGQQRQIEPAQPEPGLLIGIGGSAGDPFGIDLDTEHGQIRVDDAQPVRAFERGEWLRAVSQIHVKGVRVRAADEGAVVEQQKGIHAAQAVARGFATGGLAFGAVLMSWHRRWSSVGIRSGKRSLAISR